MIEVQVSDEKRTVAKQRGEEEEPDPDAESSDGWYPAPTPTTPAVDTNRARHDLYAKEKVQMDPN